jgi:hypothetical protein
MKDVATFRDFHDPQYDHLVLEAHDFMAGTLGLDVTTPDKMAVVPYYDRYAVAKKLGRPVVNDGQYFARDRSLYVISEEGEPEDFLVTRLVHELGHDHTLRSRRAEAAHPFLKEALAGMAEAKLADERALRRGITIPEARLVLEPLRFYLAGRYFNLAKGGDVKFSQGGLAACAMSLVSQLSGISEQEVWEAAPGGRRARHIGMMEASLSSALGPDAVSDLDRYSRTPNGVIKAAIDIESKAVRYGARMEGEEVFLPLFPARF